MSLAEAVRLALNQVVIAYAIAVVEKGNEKQMVVAKRKPFSRGIGEGEYFVASGAPFIEHTKQAVYLEDEEVALISLNKGLEIRNIETESKPHTSKS